MFFTKFAGFEVRGRRKSSLSEAIMAGEPNRIAVVTGANKGIGLGICRQLAANGIMVVLTSRDQKKGLDAVRQLWDSGLSDLVLYHQLDVTDPGSVASLADFIGNRFGRLHILVNNAGIGGITVNDPDAFRASGFGKVGAKINWGELVSQPYELAEACLETNYYGAKRMIEAHIHLLRLSDSPRVVNVSSSGGKLERVPNEWTRTVLGTADSLTEERIDEVINTFLQDFKDGSSVEKGWPVGISAYIISKAAMNAYTRVLAKKHPDVYINSVCPGFVRTDMTLHMGALSVEEGAESVVKLALQPDGGPSGRFFVRREESKF